ncbi:putative metal-binding motif-containing protein [Archangium sp.]|jgi:hypothetical protein|uniref:putative metal-binding motif-containing protein n=1 Tax=Archangium sp. TaxID=1872627 RepID=UPI002ED785AC
MRSRLASLLLLPILAGGCLPRAPEAAVRVDVSYGFKAGCITVTARDAEGEGQEAREQLEVLQRGPSTVRLAVFRQESWSHTLEITTTAHEQSCDGNEVARDVRTVKLETKAGIEQLAITLDAPDADGDGYVAADHNGRDCDDAHEDSRPGASEVCDARDNDCDGNVDQGVGSPWFPDRDGDGFGDKAATAVLSCTRPANSGTTRYVENATDCRDSDPGAFPRANFTETRCDEIDEDCDGTVDDGFAKGTSCSGVCPGGRNVCNASHTGLTCEAPQPTSYYADRDGDGAGNAQESFPVCPGATPPPGTVPNTDDCDDRDKHNRSGGSEVCDDRDNTCNTQRDEGGVCGGKGWKVFTDDPALSGDHHWKTVALGANGLVWVAGDRGALAVRTAAGQPFKSLDESCGDIHWRAAWVRPSDGHVFLAGYDANVAEHTGTSCTNQRKHTSNNNEFTGIVGFTSGTTTQLYVVDAKGRLYAWTPGSDLEERYNLYPPTYSGLHGVTSTQLFAVGGTEDTNTPYISSYPGSGGESAVTTHTPRDVMGYTGALRAVWMANSSLAYAVGDKGLVMKWSGGTSWERVTAPPDNANATFTSVVALDPSSIYVTAENGKLRRLTVDGWAPALSYSGSKPLRDIALSSPSDIWVAGDDGHVAHFPE